jgi:hypothetical protein
MILAEHSKAQCSRIIRYVGNDRARFKALMALFLTGEYRVTQRAGWPLSYCVRKYPELILPYVGPLLKNMEKKGLHDAVKRNTVRLLQDVEVPKRYHGKLMNICFDAIQSNETPVAIKAFSLTLLSRLGRQYPEILRELKAIIEDRWNLETAAFRSRGRKILDSVS